MNKVISEEHLDKYIALTTKAIDKVKIVNKKGEDMLDMATRYLSDAKHFKDKNDYVNSFACINYAHGWLDAGARLGFFDVGGDNKLFTVD